MITTRLLEICSEVRLDSLLKQREIYSIIQDYFGEDNTDYIEGNKSDNYIDLEYILQQCSNNLYSKNSSEKAFKELLNTLVRRSVYYYEKLNKNYSLVELVDLLFYPKVLKHFKCSSITIPADYCYTNEKEKDAAIALFIKHFTELISNTSNSYVLHPNTNIVYIKFPKLTITNELGKSHTLLDTYIELQLGVQYIIPKFSLARGTLTEDEYIANYAFSHASGGTTSFTSALCFGSGPIDSTRAELLMSLDYYSPHKIQLFCYELENYLQVESIAGGPYRRMENIGNQSTELITSFNDVLFTSTANINIINNKYPLILTEFFSYVIDNHLDKFKFKYNGKAVVIGLNISEIIQLLTNLFIECIFKTNQEENQRIIANYLQMGYINNTGLYFRQNNIDRELPQNLQPFCTFKGQPITTNIIKNEELQLVKFLSPIRIKRFILDLTYFINTKYHE